MKIFSRLLIVISLSAYLSAPVLAVVDPLEAPNSENVQQEEKDIRTQEREQKLADKEAEREEKAAERYQFKCEKASSRIDVITENYTEKFNRHAETYRNIITRVDTVLTELSAKGYDTSEAELALADFSSQLDEIEVEFEEFVISLENNGDELCADSEYDFKAGLQESKAKLREVRSKLLKLRSIYQDQVKPALLELREQIRNSADGEERTSDVEIQKPVDRDSAQEEADDSVEDEENDSEPIDDSEDNEVDNT